MSTHRIAGQPANVQPNNTPPSNPSPGDDAVAIARADDWLFSEHSPDAVGDECFPMAVAVATVLREFGLSALMARDRVESWSLFACSPQLEQAEVDLAVREAYGTPASAVPPQPSSAIVAPTAPSSLPAAALVTTTMPNLVVNTPPECALCAARRKAKRERTRRWRALRARPATKKGEVANG